MLNEGCSTGEVDQIRAHEKANKEIGVVYKNVEKLHFEQDAELHDI